MRRIKAWPDVDNQVLISKRDYRLMRAVVRAADKWWNNEVNGMTAVKLVDNLGSATDAFNAPEKRKP